jgi:cytochrome c2
MKFCRRNMPLGKITKIAPHLDRVADRGTKGSNKFQNTHSHLKASKAPKKWDNQDTEPLHKNLEIQSSPSLEV